MTDTSLPSETSRRTLIAAVAAAGAAAPLMATSAKAQNDEFKCPTGRPKWPRPRFVVDLGDVSLPPDVADALGREIRKAVLITLARAGEPRQQAEFELPRYWRGYMAALEAELHPEQFQQRER
jgi:hypothetical protein